MLVDLVTAAQKEDWTETRNILYKHWLTVCPKIYRINSEQPWEGTSIDELMANEQLYAPLVSAFCLDSQINQTDLAALNNLAGIDPEKNARQICGHVFKSGELTYSCRDCATDGTCVMCLECFELSIHKSHKYTMRPSGGSGYCDCGDVDAWTDGYACPMHMKNEEQSTAIPDELEERCSKLVEMIMFYCIKLLTKRVGFDLPTFLEEIRNEIKKDAAPQATQYLTVLYNDETHTYDSVIKVLERIMHCTKDQAILVATIVDREGRSAVKLGNKADCLKVMDEIKTRTQREASMTLRRAVERLLPLNVSVMETVLFAHQNHAISLLSWLNAQMEVFAPLRRIVGEVFLRCRMSAEESSNERRQNATMLEMVLLDDSTMWIAANTTIHQMLMKTVFMDYDQKVEYAKTFMKHYEDIYDDFIFNDHDMDVSVIGLSIQFLTVPGLARRLLAEDDALSIMSNSIIESTSKYVKGEKFDFNQRSFPGQLRRSLHMCRDMAFLLNAVPAESDWNDELREKFLNGCRKFVNFLGYLQGMDEVKRQSVEHQVWESEWETAFNILLRIKDVLTLIIQWASTDKIVHNRLLTLCIEKMEEYKITSTDENGATHICVEVEGQKSMLRSFDVLRGGVSIHQPIPRLIAGLFSTSKFVEFLVDGTELNEMQKNISTKVALVGKDLYELSLRVLVLCAQANAQLWRRNGFSLVNQIHNYFSPMCRGEMFDRDVLMLQIGAALTPTKDFLLHLLHRYRIVPWADPAFEGVPRNQAAKIDTEDLSKVTVTLAEEFLHLLILIVGERFQTGIGEVSQMDSLKREIVHILCTGSQTFSYIQHKLSHNVQCGKKHSLHDAVNEVAEFRKPVATSAGQFYLKEELLWQYNPFFVHYSKSDQSAAEQHQARVRQKMSAEVRACAPPRLPKFERFYENILELLRSPILVGIIRVVIDRTAKRNRYSSDRLFQKALYLVGMALNEQENDGSFDFTTIAEESQLLAAMEAIQGKSESAICHLLLDHIVEKYKKLHNSGSGVKVETEVKESRETVEEMKAKRAARAAEMRKKAMAKMSSMQNKFVKQMETSKTSTSEKLEEELPNTPQWNYDEDVVKQIPADGSEFPVCIGSARWRAEIVAPRKVTCILCQEDEPVHPTNGKPMVCAAFIQRSQLFVHKNNNGQLMTAVSGGISTRDLLTAPATLQYGVDVSTCSHCMHFECYKNMSETMKSRDSLRTRQQQNTLNHKMVDAENGEYQCPLCKRLSNAAIPIVPCAQLTPSVGGFSQVSETADESFDGWVKRVKRHLDAPLSEGVARKKGHSRKRSHSERSLLDLEKQCHAMEKTGVDDGVVVSFGSTTALSNKDVEVEAMEVGASKSESVVVEDSDEQEFYRELANFLNQNAPEVATPVRSTTESSPISDGVRKVISNQFQHAISSLIRPLPALINAKNKLCSSSLEPYEDAIKELGKNMIRFRRRGAEKTKFLEKHLKGYVVATVTWQSTAHVARAISSYLHYDGKPLFGALNSRQRDCLSAMARLCSSLSHNLQFLPHAVGDMLRILFCEPPKKIGESNELAAAASSSAGGSSASPNNFAFIIQLFNPTGPRKHANLNILQVDILSHAISLMMSIGWAWKSSGSQQQKTRQLCPDGSIDESHVLRLSLIAHYFQIIATFDEEDPDDYEVDDDAQVDMNEETTDLLRKLFSICRGSDRAPSNLGKLHNRLIEGAQLLLRPIALIYHFLTLVEPPEALKDPSIVSTEPLFRYLNLPSKIEEQLGGELVESMMRMWAKAVPLDETERKELVVQPVRANVLIDLPEEYSELIQRAATFRCPSIRIEESKTNVPTICLVCGVVLCSQAYCCQKIIDKQSYGACRYHMRQCSGSVGIFLRVRDCYLVLMASRKRGCFRPAPYVDEFGEVDEGFRRGNPLKLNKDLYQKLKMLWLQQGIMEEVVNYNEIDLRNVQYDWAHF